MTKEDKAAFKRIEKKLDEIMDHLFDPDVGLYKRVNDNSRWRKGGQWLLGLLLTGILISIIALIIRG